MILVLIGNGTVANVVLKKTLGNSAGWLVICFGFLASVMLGVFTAVACGSDAAYINPGVTLAFAVRSGDFSNLLPFWLAQLLGAMAGGILVWVNFLPHWGETPDPGTKLACFSTGPAIRSFFPNLFSEALGTFLLAFFIAAIVKMNPAPGVAPWMVGSAVWAVGLSMGGTTGFAINPARDLGPRIVHAINRGTLQLVCRVPDAVRAAVLHFQSRWGNRYVNPMNSSHCVEDAVSRAPQRSVALAGAMPPIGPRWWLCSRRQTTGEFGRRRL
jgi:glycerol uptake facilitator protein